MSKYYSARGARRGAQLCLMAISLWALWAVSFVMWHRHVTQSLELHGTFELVPIVPGKEAVTGRSQRAALSQEQ